MKRETKIKKILKRLETFNDEELQTIYLMVAIHYKLIKYFNEKHDNKSNSR
jgi:hypothetical protein